MDFDSIISVLLILLFFIFPTLLKRFNKKKNTAETSPAGKARKLSLFERLGEQIREYAQALEQEAQKGKQPRENIWDHLADEDEFQTIHEDSFEEADSQAYRTESLAAESAVPAADSAIQENRRKRSVPKSEKHGQKQGPDCDPSWPGTHRQPKLSSCQLQQAIIWSEILSKPVALRQDTTRDWA